MATKVLKVGKNRVWVDPEKTDEVESAITNEEIRKLIHEKTIRKIPEKGVSRARARVLHEKKRRGRKRGPGSRVGSQNARVAKKEAWMSKVRALRENLREMKDKHVITESVYRQLYVKVKTGSFESVSDLQRYLEAHNLRRKR